MTTARERMKALSGLVGDHTARAHFLAITQGTGDGTTVVIGSGNGLRVRLDVSRNTTTLSSPRQRLTTEASTPFTELTISADGGMSLVARPSHERLTARLSVPVLYAGLQYAPLITESPTAPSLQTTTVQQVIVAKNP